MTDTTKEKNQTQTQPKRELTPVRVNDLGILKPSNLQEAIEVAKIIAHSGFVPKLYEGNAPAVLVCVQMGSELGLSPMTALRSIAVINGKPSIYGDGMLAIVTSRPDCEDIIESFDDATMTATCTIKRAGRTPKTAKFSQVDAKTANLWGKSGPWTQYPKRMLQMRARGFALRDAFPDALSGIISAEEAHDMVIDAEFTAPEPTKPPEGKASFGAKKRVEVIEGDRVIDAATGEVIETKPTPADEAAGF